MQGGQLTMNAGSILLGAGTTSTSGGQKTATGYMSVSGGTITTPGIRLTNGFDSNATLTLSGGTVNVTAIGRGTDPSNLFSFGFTGGHLNVQDSSISIANNGGTMTPGNNGAVGTTAFSQDNSTYDQNSGTFYIDIGAGSFDTMTLGAEALNGTANFNGGTIFVQTVGGFDPGAGNTWDVVFADLVTLNPSTVVVGSTPGGIPFTASVESGGTILRITTTVPEPSAVAITLLAGAFLVRRRTSARPRPDAAVVFTKARYQPDLL